MNAVAVAVLSAAVFVLGWVLVCVALNRRGGDRRG